ncbi:MAG: sulfatase-like hydrolase/transferase [Polyangiaceae bacterium]|nr:sulfatase-like hydrolase/transferase [Polyangiaceae bacterium]
MTSPPPNDPALPTAAAPPPPGHARRWAAAVAGAGVAIGAGAAVDARWALGGQVSGAALLPAYGAALGLGAPLAFGIGCAVGAAASWLHPAAPPSPAGARAWLEPAGPQRATRSALALVAPLAVAVWIVVAARLALAVLSAGSDARTAGATLGLGALALGIVTAIGAGGLVRVLAEWPAIARLPGRLALGVGAAGLVAVIGAGVLSGTTGGTGGTLAVFGVLKREELDLRGVGLAAAIGVAAYVAPHWLARRSWLTLAAYALGPLLTLAVANRELERDAELALSIERGAPLARHLLGPLRRLRDADGDGASAWLGGGDCDDRSAAIGPGADDLPGNGVDEDCSGADAREVVLDAPAPAAVERAAGAKLPEGANVLLLTVDTLRWDLGYAGNPRPVSPNLDRLAARSIVFEKAYALASYTSKSLAPMLIGKYGSETHRGWSHFNVYGREDTFVQERLQRAGIRTVSVQAHWYFKENTGLGRGFDVLDLSASPRQLQQEGDRSVVSDRVTDAAIAQLGKPENTGRRFFAWVHYLDPHAEYVESPRHDFGDAERDKYDSEVAFTDEHVGRLLDFLEKQGLLEETIIIVTSDHGEAFGEHGMIRHGFEVWEELVRVPFFVFVPGLTAKKISVRRSQIDLVPTLLEIFGVARPSGEGADFVSGVSTVPELLAPPGAALAPRVVFVDMAAGPNNADRQAFVDGDLKLIASGGRPIGLYDLSADPEEKKNLLRDAAVAEPAVERYRAFRRRLREVVVKPVPR